MTDRLINRLENESFALTFAGQGYDWRASLTAALAAGVGSTVSADLAEAEELLAPVADALAAARPHGFDPVGWATEAPSGIDTQAAAVSVPGILAAQTATAESLRRQGLHLTGAVAVAGHSQGALAAYLAEGRATAAQLLAIAQLIGAAGARAARAAGLVRAGESSPMVSLAGASRERVEEAIAAAGLTDECVVGLLNGREHVVLVGAPADNERVVAALEAAAAKTAKAIEAKRRGGAAPSLRVNPLDVQIGFHHPALAPAVEQVVAWAQDCGLDADLAKKAAQAVLTTFVDWPAEITRLTDAGAQWILDLGPADGVVALTERAVRGRGVGVLAVASSDGQAQLFDAGLAPARPTPYAQYAPRVVTHDGDKRLVTKFTRVTGRSPMLLAGMTPTTVDPEIVAAAANAGHWSELAGGGQVTEAIFHDNLARLTELLEPGVAVQFNTMFLDPSAWGKHISTGKWVPKARANGAPFDGVTVSAGAPDPEEATQLIADLRAGGFPHISFKPGAIKQIRRVLRIADAVDTPVILQVEGGKAGGHHSWESLDEQLIATYDEIRARDNAVLAVGGGVGTPERAAEYLTGSWAEKYGLPAMPVDAIMIGTTAMAAKEATATESVKQALAAAKGTDKWIGASTAEADIASGLSSLGADLHEIDNSFARAGRLVDEVAGDAEAVAARRDEIIQALNKTCKPYYGDLETMTYRAWLERYLELAGPDHRGWLDVTWHARFVGMLERAEARLTEIDHGPFTPVLDLELGDDPQLAVDTLGEIYPDLDEVLEPADAAWFLRHCRSKGKPVPFVPVIDAEVRRWFRADTFWQAHDERYGANADAVCIIPGPEAVAGIERANEPIAELMERFNAAAVAAATDAGAEEIPAPGLVERVLAAPAVEWAGRQQNSPVTALGEEWELAGDGRSAQLPTGASLVQEDETNVVLTVPLTGSLPGNKAHDLQIRLSLAADAPAGAVPIVARADAEAATTELTRLAAGGELPQVVDGVATHSVTVSAADLADYDTVTAGYLPADSAAVGTAPDVLVGKAWPAIFAAIADAEIPGTDGAKVVEGMLNLVHLEHRIELHAPLPTEAELAITARVDAVTDTIVGRVVEITAEIAGLATLTERFAIQGRRGDAPAPAPTAADTVVDTARSFRAQASVTAPASMRPFAIVTGDRNPIHVADAAARMAGLSDGVIVHGMWTSALGEIVAASDGAGQVVEYTATMLAPVLPGAQVDYVVERTGVDARPGRGEVRSVTATVDGETVLTATAVMAEASTFYGFPGQGIQSPGMGMAQRAASPAAKEVWDRADRHTRAKLGFSILEIVQNNPAEVVVGGCRYQHPDGVLYLTQFTQVAMATLGCAQIAEMKEAGVLNDRAYFAGHSVGEYNALAAYAQVLSLEGVVEIVYRRGLTMHHLVPRNDAGVSDYALAALRPYKMGLSGTDVQDYVAQMARRTGEFLEIVNYNIDGRQYAVAGTLSGLQALAADAESRGPGNKALVMIPGIDVPFHSSQLLGGVDDFRAHLDELIPDEVDAEVLVDRYIPNLVARPFELTEDFVRSIAEVVDSPYITALLDDFAAAAEDETALARTLLIELLAWQFASPVRWIETQDLLLTGLGVDRFVEVGVGASPTLSNMLGQTMNLPQYAGSALEVLNVERDRSVVFAEDAVAKPSADVDEDAAGDAESPDVPAEVTDQAADPAPTPAAVASAPVGERPADLEYGAADALELLVAVWTKVRPDQIGAADTIESLVEGVSSRRNQVLLDLGNEFGTGSIDGAADAPFSELSATIVTMARGYGAFGPVLTESVADSLRRVTGPTGKKPGHIAERVTGHWQLGQGWVDHTIAALVMGTRDGASLRGGDLATLQPAAPASAAELDALIDAAVQSVATAHGMQVAPPAAGGSAGGVVDSAALGEFAEQVTGADGVLATTARDLLKALGLDQPASASFDAADDNAELFDLVSRELGSDWPRQVAPRFNADEAVLLDDRWASAREDVTRAGLGQIDPAALDVTGAGEEVARQAEHFELAELAAQARDTAALDFAEDVAVVTGASPNSIAAAVVGDLLAGGATVVVTTSNLGHQRLEFYKELYRTHARGRAALWIVPANLSAYTDLDALIAWIGQQQTVTVGAEAKVVKPAMVPSLLFPFAAPRVTGSLADAGGAAETQMRLLLWSVERLIAGLSALGADTHLGHRLHVVLPGSPNRGRFGGDGAYGEAKAALDAVVTRWHAEPVWGERTSLVHALIGWVRGTGLMGGNDPLVEAVEAKGVTTYSTEEIAERLISQASAQVRSEAASAPVTADFTGGLGEADINLAELAANRPQTDDGQAADAERKLPALPSPYRRIEWTDADFGKVEQRLEDMVVIVGGGELGPYGTSRTRFDAELTGDLTAAGVTELAWNMGLISVADDGTFLDADGADIAEEEIYERYHDEVLAGVGIRRYDDAVGLVDNLAPELTTVYLEHDLTFQVSDAATARSFIDSDPEHTTAVAADDGEWSITRTAGAPVSVPRRMAMSRFVGGQVPAGFDPSVYGVPADMLESIDRVAVWNLVCTVEAFLSAGFTPAELLSAVHPARVSSTMGTGMGGTGSIRGMYVDRLLNEPRANDILQEALPNVVAAHVMQSYVGGYGQMIHPVAACATAAVSVEEGVDKIRLGKADAVVAGGIDDLSVEGIEGFGNMNATADSAEMEAKGIEHRYFSRANDRRRGGFVEAEGGGTLLLLRGSLAYELGLPVLGVVGFAESFADGAHTSIPAPGLGALSAARGGMDSRLARALAELDVTPDDVSIVSKHDTSTNANDPNESDLHHRIAAATGRDAGKPLYVISQKSLTGHSKGGAAAFQAVGLTQVLRSGLVPANRSLDCVDPALREHGEMVWLRKPLDLRSAAPKAGVLTSLGFGHVSALVAIVHPGAFLAAVRAEHGERAARDWQASAERREKAGLRRVSRAILGREALYERPVERNLGGGGAAAKEREAAVLLDERARLVDGVLQPEE